MRNLLALAVCLGLFSVVTAQAPVENYDFTLADAERLLAESRGSVVVFHIYASWCPPCRDEIPAVIRVGERYKNHPFRMLALSLDRNNTDLSKFLTSKKVNFEPRRLTTPLTTANLAPLKSMGISYQGSIPYTAIFDPSGKLVKQWTGARPYSGYVSALDEVYLKLDAIEP